VLPVEISIFLFIFLICCEVFLVSRMREVQRSTDTKRNYGVTEIKSEGKGQISHWTCGFSIEFPINKYTLFLFLFLFLEIFIHEL